MVEDRFYDPFSTDRPQDVSALVCKADGNTLKAILWVITGIMEDVTRLEWNIMNNPDFDSTQFGHLLLAFGEERCQWLMQTNDGRSKSILAKLCGLLTSEGVPGIENRVFVAAIEFWSNLTETMSDLVYSGEIPTTPWAKQALDSVLEAVSNAWHKIIYPPQEVVNKWDSSDRVVFAEARKDVIDFFQSVYSLCGSRMVAIFVELVLTAVNDAAWPRLEAATYCLAGLAECGRGDAALDVLMTPVFESSLFTDLASPNGNIPNRTRQTCVYMIEQYTEYFQRNISSLAPALRLLFHLLGDRSMAASASKSILRLCSSCRHHLYSEADGFLAEYRNLSLNERLDCTCSEKIAGAIASVIQAIPNQDERSHASTMLLEHVYNDVLLAKELFGRSAEAKMSRVGHQCGCDTWTLEHPALHSALKALKCLHSIGRGFQSPAESPIELDNGSLLKAKNDGHLALSHRKVVEIITDIEAIFGQNAEVMELICAILRCGFSEGEPGPFVLDVDVVTRYLTSHNVNTPRPGLLVTTAASFVSSLQIRTDVDKESTYAVLLHWVVSLLRSLSVLDGNEPLPKGAAAEFWGDQADVQEPIMRVMDMLGPLLVQSLIRNIGGRGSRSELDKLSEPLKKLIQGNVGAKGAICQEASSVCKFCRVVLERKLNLSVLTANKVLGAHDRRIKLSESFGCQPEAAISPMLLDLKSWSASSPMVHIKELHYTLIPLYPSAPR
ncbi:hypothetical protein UVI_02060760 [Ustilaginoidea virens]|uniref:Importin 13 n=1 Tax=Ustilaginoidea virens TaxID=1159556 RepID=A0A1B5L8K5_USTVR|nr:hypothetical protein UVI_02060760 [Ustilaginoidea virens]